MKKLQTMLFPMPKQVHMGEGSLCLHQVALEVTADTHTAGCAGQLLEKKLEALGVTLCEKAEIKITLALGEAPENVSFAEQAYAIKIDQTGVKLTGFGPRGVYYAAVTFVQMLGSREIPCCEILDWPDMGFRGHVIETRLGSDLMEKEDWFAMIDDFAAQKINHLQVNVYGCWVVQYDGRVSEYLFVPLEGYPELKTGFHLKYYSPTQDKWIEADKLPPMFEKNFFGDLVAYGYERGVKVFPGFNSYGHNTLIPHTYPELSAKDEDGNPSYSGFCTANPDVYKLLFSAYDQLIDKYMKPYGSDCIALQLDEVWAEIGQYAGDIFSKRSPWCKCPKCRDQSKGQLFIPFTIKLIKHLKEKGMKTVIMYWDMLLPGVRAYSTNILDDFIAAAKEADVLDVLMLDWWTYLSKKEALDFDSMHPELNIRGIAKPWNGYYVWDILNNAMPNVQLLAEMNHRDKGLGIVAYATWDRSYDLTHDAIADYAWDYERSGSLDEITDRYVRRNFAPRYEQTRHAYRLVFDWILENRYTSTEDPKRRILSNSGLMMSTLMYYYQYAGISSDKPFPRNFLGEALEKALSMRHDVERCLYIISALSQEALAIFNEAAADPRCNQAIARRMAYECHNYLCICRDWISILQMYDLCQAGQVKAVVPIARARQEARKTLIGHAMDAKEHCTTASLTLRNHSIFMQQFADIADYVESNDAPKLDLLNIMPILRKQSLKLR